MCSTIPKVLHPLCGIPLLERVLQQVFDLEPSAVGIVVGHEGKQVMLKIPQNARIAFSQQTEPLGSGHAVLSALPWIKSQIKTARHLLILCGDTPLITAATLQKFISFHESNRNSVSVLSEVFANPFGYGRIVKDAQGRVRKIVEEKDASAQEKKIQETNSGIYCCDVSALMEALPLLSNDNAKHEYYLTDIVEILNERGYMVKTMEISPEEKHETLGINSREDLAFAEKILQKKIHERWMKAGVTILNPEFTYIGEEVSIGSDTVILPGTILLGKTIIGEHSSIGPHSLIENSEIGSRVSIRSSYVYSSKIKNDAQVGPFSHLRSGCVIEEGARIGNFTEVKNSTVGKKSKVSHLSYIGDATLGDEINVGAGAITCNFDGKKKHRTVIGSRSFIGSNVNLIAPVEIGNGSIVGAGSTITKNIPSDSLSVERSKQVIKNGWTKRKQK